MGGLSRFVMALAAGIFLFKANNAEAFCVQTFNAYGPAYASDVEGRTHAFGAALREQGVCPVLVLQEVWRDSHRELLREEFQLWKSESHFLVSDHSRADGYNTGLSLLSWSPIAEEVSHVYAVNEDGATDWIREMLGVRKGYSVFRIQDEGDLGQILFINTHLHHASEEMRLAQILELASFLIDDEGFARPVILAGDLNFTRDTMEWLLLNEILGFEDSSPADLGCTYCSENPLSWDSNDRKIDFIWSRSSLTQKIVATQSQIIFKEHAGRPLSDHYGLQSDFTFIPQLTTMSYIQYWSTSASQFVPKISRLYEIRQQLSRTGRRDLKAAIGLIDGLIERFERAEPSDPLIRFWLENLSPESPAQVTEIQ